MCVIDYPTNSVLQDTVDGSPAIDAKFRTTAIKIARVSGLAIVALTLSGTPAALAERLSYNTRSAWQ